MIQGAIQAAIALLKKSAQDLADGVSIGGVPQWESEPSTESAHDEILIAADGLVSASARIARLESQLAKMQPVINAAQEWNSERSPRDFEEADLMKALAAMDGDWPGCEGCNHQCDEPCMPTTVAEIHASIDRHMEKLEQQEKVEAKAETERLDFLFSSASYVLDGDKLAKGGA